MHYRKVTIIIIFNVFCVYVCLLPNVIYGQSYSSSRCITPKKEDGECLLIPQCPPIMSILQHRPVTPENVEYLRQSGCGFEGLEPKVCCPLQTPPTTTTTTSSPFSSGGPAINLLPDMNNCGVISANRIVGGTEADLQDFPWMALLEYQTRTGKGFYCGGVLIHNRYVLTAAHCIKGKDLPTTWRLISVRLGEFNTSSEIDCQLAVASNTSYCNPKALDIPIESQIAHEDYDPFDINQYHDIGLLRLTETVPLSGSVAPICLPQGNLLKKSFEDTKMVVAGWGKTETRSASEVLMKLQIDVRKNSECIPTYKNVRVNIEDGQLCGGGLRGQDSCRGDSGGPLMVDLTVDGSYNFYAVGVVSFGPSPCGLQGWPGVYTRITKYIPWIINKLKP